MGTRQHKTKGWVIFAVFCAVLFCMAALRACAAKAAPEGCSLKRVRPAQTACFPLGTTAWRVSDAYGWRTDPITGEETFHRGTDLACSEGTLALAAMDGVVTAARRSATYGNYLCLSHSGRQETLYAHLQYLFVRAGEVVQAGQPLELYQLQDRHSVVKPTETTIEKGAENDETEHLCLKVILHTVKQNKRTCMTLFTSVLGFPALPLSPTFNTSKSH